MLHFKKMASCLILLLALVGLNGTATANLDRQQLNTIYTALESSEFSHFKDFLSQLSNSSAGSSEVRALKGLYLEEQSLSREQSNLLYRLLGVYTRLSYAEQSLDTLRELVEIPTFQQEGVAQHQNPNFHQFAAVLENIAEGFDLEFRNIDNRVYEITLEGDSEELIGIHAHADVVPVNPELWILPDGTALNPFAVTKIDKRLYGRGTEDDKNGIVASLYAMKVIKEEDLTLLRNIRLLVDTTEETSSEAIPYYFERNPTPDYNIALDGSYPVVIAEKGYGTVMAQFPIRRGSGEGAEIISISGGLASNQIPSASVARIQSARPEELASQLNERASLYRVSHGANFGIEAVADNTQVILSVNGISAHSSEPQSGINPVSRMLDFLHSLSAEGIFRRNHITDAAHYASVNWGLDYLGNTLGLAYADDFMGPLTTALTFVDLDNQQLRLAVNLRLPIGRAPNELIAEISAKLNDWTGESAVDVSFNFSASDPMYRNPEGAWVNALLDIATETLDMPRKFGSSAGGTSIHNLPNGVQFGLAMPDLKYSGHNANEFKSIDQFLIDLQIVTEMFARIGSMPEL